MFCIYCGRLGDYHDSHACQICRNNIANNNRQAYIISLLAEAYNEVQTIRLRKKIEDILFPQHEEL